MKNPKLPLVYSCSGCSNVAQLANTIAVRLDRAGLAEMSCIAGVGGRVSSLVSTANSGRPILAIDGCRLQCVRGCLDQHDVQASVHLVLSEQGLKKRYGEDFSSETVDEAYLEVVRLLDSEEMQFRPLVTVDD
ncbi:zinc-binding protein [Pseudomonas sp. PDM16]|uniref:putative zinc-binding protein n=1 Tax=Pseudomonas sp. PDM16 TaxID=2769292 RepID=UPI001780AB6C|nr:putative zinc-binding protein [Pseudomonas sp. PDM16]MBD9417499.1 zinc-binding protein [Pseudomonas sp. PDM16]